MNAHLISPDAGFSFLVLLLLFIFPIIRESQHADKDKILSNHLPWWRVDFYINDIKTSSGCSCCLTDRTLEKTMKHWWADARRYI